MTSTDEDYVTWKTQEQLLNWPDANILFFINCCFQGETWTLTLSVYQWLLIFCTDNSTRRVSCLSKPQKLPIVSHLTLSMHKKNGTLEAQSNVKVTSPITKLKKKECIYSTFPFATCKLSLWMHHWFIRLITSTKSVC